MNMKESIQVAAIKQAYAYLDKDPDANLPRLMDLADKLDTGNAYAAQRAAVRDALSNPDNNWYRLARSLWDDVDSSVRKRLFENFVINANFLWAPRHEAARERYGCNIPWTILMDPTSGVRQQAEYEPGDPGLHYLPGQGAGRAYVHLFRRRTADAEKGPDHPLRAPQRLRLLLLHQRHPH